MKNMKYTIQEGKESLERVKLMMKYDLNKTLNENVNLIEQKTNCPNSITFSVLEEKANRAGELFKLMDSPFIRLAFQVERSKEMYDILKKLENSNVLDDITNECVPALSKFGEYFETSSKGSLFGWGGKPFPEAIASLKEGGLKDNLQAKRYLDAALNIFQGKKPTQSTTTTTTIAPPKSEKQKKGFKTIEEFKKAFPCVFPNSIVEEKVLIDGKGTSYVKVKGDTGVVYRMYSTGNLYWENPFQRTYKKIVCKGNDITLSEGKIAITEQGIPDAQIPRTKSAAASQTRTPGGQRETKVQPPANLTPEQTTEVQQALLSLGYELGSGGSKFNGVTGTWNKDTQQAFDKFKQENYGSGRANIGSLLGDGYYSLSSQEKRKTQKDTTAIEKQKKSEDELKAKEEVKTKEEKLNKAKEDFNKFSKATFVDFSDPAQIRQAYQSVNSLMKRMWRSIYFYYFYQSLKSYISLNPENENVEDYKQYLQNLKAIGETSASKAGAFDFDSFTNPTPESVKDNYEELSLSAYSPWKESGKEITAYRLVGEFDVDKTKSALDSFIQKKSASPEQCLAYGNAYLKLARIPEITKKGKAPAAPAETVLSQNMEKRQLQAIKAIVAACKRNNQYTGDMLTRIEKLDDVDLGPRLQINFQVIDPNKQPY